MALMILTMEAAYLRPGEAQLLRVQDLLPPTGGANPGLQLYGLMLGPSDRGLPTKAQVFDDTVVLDHPSWLAPLLAGLTHGRVAGASLFAVDHEALKREWKACQELLGLHGTALYQLRHGGASEDALSRRRLVPEIMSRGRWAALTSVRRYTKPGLVQKVMRDLTTPNREYVLWCSANLQAVMEGTLVPPLPPALGGALPAARPATRPRATRAAPGAAPGRASASSTRPRRRPAAVSSSASRAPAASRGPSRR